MSVLEIKSPDKLKLEMGKLKKALKRNFSPRNDLLNKEITNKDIVKFF